MSKDFYFSFYGASSYWIVKAATLKSAKEKFLEHHNIISSSYITYFRKQPVGCYVDIII